MHPEKSPEPNNFNPCCYQKFWDIMGGHVISSCLQWLNSGNFPDDIHDTVSVFIPNQSTIQMISNLRPNTLCNIMYKFVSKTIVNSLKTVLPFIISDHHSVFIPERLIYHNVMLAYEVTHFT